MESYLNNIIRNDVMIMFAILMVIVLVMVTRPPA